MTASIAEFPMKYQSKKKVSNLVVMRICIVVIHIWNTPVVIKDSSYAMVFYLLIIFINEERMLLYYLENLSQIIRHKNKIIEGRHYILFNFVQIVCTNNNQDHTHSGRNWQQWAMGHYTNIERWLLQRRLLLK